MKHYYFEEKGKKICNHQDKECPINDTVAGSTCPSCVQYGFNGVNPSTHFIDAVAYRFNEITKIKIIDFEKTTAYKNGANKAILELLHSYKSEVDNFNDAIFTDDFEKITEEIVKLFPSLNTKTK